MYSLDHQLIVRSTEICFSMDYKMAVNHFLTAEIWVDMWKNKTTSYCRTHTLLELKYKTTIRKTEMFFSAIGCLEKK